MKSGQNEVFSVYSKLVLLLSLWVLVAYLFGIQTWFLVPRYFIGIFFTFLAFSFIHQKFEHRRLSVIILYVVSLPFLPFGLDAIQLIYALIARIPVEAIGAGLLFYVFPILAIIFALSYGVLSLFDKLTIVFDHKSLKIITIILASLVLLFLFYSVFTTGKKVEVENQNNDRSRTISELIEDVSFDKNLSPKEKLAKLDTFYNDCMELSNEKSQSFCIQNVFDHKASIGLYNQDIEKDLDVPALICSDSHKDLEIVKKYPNPYGSYLIKASYSECLETLKISS